MSHKYLYAPGEDIAFCAKPVALVEPVPTPSVVSVFTLSKDVRESFVIDGTALAPSKAVMVSVSRFEQSYKDQLSKLLYNDADKLDHHALMVLTSISDIVESSQRPIRLMSQAFHKKMPTLCKALNDFYQANHAVIRGISQQLSN